MNDLNVKLNEPIFTISAAAKLLGISVHTLRMYEREGLFIRSKRVLNTGYFLRQI
jgi:MerR family transcriptional regulator/heat shock protein HspR